MEKIITFDVFSISLTIRFHIISCFRALHRCLLKITSLIRLKLCSICYLILDLMMFKTLKKKKEYLTIYIQIMKRDTEKRVI